MVAQIIQAWGPRIIGPLVVSGVLALFGGGLYTYRMDSRISAIEKWQEKTEDNRYKFTDGLVEKLHREINDKMHLERMVTLDEENIRLWTAIRKHIEIGEHRGAGYRLKALEKHVEDEKEHNEK